MSTSRELNFDKKVAATMCRLALQAGKLAITPGVLTSRSAPHNPGLYAHYARLMKELVEMRLKFRVYVGVDRALEDFVPLMPRYGRWALKIASRRAWNEHDNASSRWLESMAERWKNGPQAGETA